MSTHNMESESVTIEALSQILAEEQEKVVALNKSNDAFKTTINELTQLAQSLSLTLTTMKNDFVQFESLRSQLTTVETERDTLKRSNKVLKDLVSKKSSILGKINTISEDVSEEVTPAVEVSKNISNLKSAKQAKFRNHRKSRSFGFGDTIQQTFKTFNKDTGFKINFNSPSATPTKPNFNTLVRKLEPEPKLSFKKPTMTYAHNKSMESLVSDDNNSDYSNVNSSPKSCATTIDSLAEPSRNFMGVTKKNSKGSLKISLAKSGNGDGLNNLNLNSPVTETKMNQLFGTSNTLLVNMKRPIRGFKKLGGNSEYKEQPQKQNNEPPLVTYEDTENALAEMIDDLEDDANMEICEATSVGFKSLDPKYVMTPKTQLEENSSVPVLEQSPNSNSSKIFMSNVSSAGASPKRVPFYGVSGQNGSFDNFLSSPYDGFAGQSSQFENFTSLNPMYSKNERNNSFENLAPQRSNNSGLYSVKSNNNSNYNLNMNAQLAPSMTNGSMSSNTNLDGSGKRKKNFMKFEKPESSFFRRHRANSNSSLRNLF